MLPDAEKETRAEARVGWSAVATSLIAAVVVGAILGAALGVNPLLGAFATYGAVLLVWVFALAREEARDA